MSKILFKILDNYNKHPFVWDALITLSIWALSTKIEIYDFKYLDKDNQINLTSSIIENTVSLAGFILAALTIIVTFKSNIKAKNPDAAESPLELIFSSKYYSQIVSVFKSAITEFTIIFITLYLVWMYAENLSVTFLNFINLTTILLSALILVRTLTALFQVINLPEKSFKARSEGE
jgi:glycerol uptake facilitator-like aquaporin